MAGLSADSTSANHLLDFVSNASKELKDMIGKVDNDEKGDNNSDSLFNGLNVHLPATPMTSPVPSPTPSCVSSISDQEVPSMSPRFFAGNARTRTRRKRSIDSAGEAPAFEFMEKVRRADSVGDYEEYYPSCALDMRRRQAYVCGSQASSMELESRLQQQSYRKLHATHSQQFDELHPTQQQFYYGKPMQKSNMQNYYDYSTFVSNQQHFTTAFNYQQQAFQQQPNPVDSVPDFADLVSWMLAEDFLDADTLSTLLSRC